MASIKSKQGEQPLPDVELIQCLWQALISSVEWSARQDQNEALALREITVRHSYISSRISPLHICCFYRILYLHLRGFRTSLISSNHSATAPRRKWPSLMSSKCTVMKIRESSRHFLKFSKYVPNNLSVEHVVDVNDVIRYCIKRSVSQTKLSYTGTRKVPSPRAGNISSTLHSPL